MPIFQLVLSIIILAYAAVGIFFMIRGIVEAFRERDLTPFGRICVVLLCSLFIAIWAPLWIYYEIKAARREAKHLDKSGKNNKSTH